MTARRPVLGVGVACWKDDRVLLVKRAKPPLAGDWSLPGGKVEWGEALKDAALRELHEETGVAAEILALVDAVDAVFPSAEHHFVLIDFAALWRSGEAEAASDAADARWFSLEDACDAVGWDETVRILRASHALVGAATIGGSI